MGIAKMNKVYLIAHQAEKNKVLAVLQQLGVLEVNDLQAKDMGNEAWAELVESDQEQEALQALEGYLTDVRFALDFLNRHVPAKKSMLDALSASKTSIIAGDLSANAVEWKHVGEDTYKALRRIDEKLMSLRNEETRLQNLKLQLAPWQKLALPLEEVKVTTAVRVELGTLPVTEVDPARQALAEVVPTCYFEEIGRDRHDAYVLIVNHNDTVENIQTALKTHSYSKHQFPQLTGTPAEVLERIKTDLVNLEAERKIVLAKVKEQAKHRDTLNFYNDYLTMERDKKQVVANFARTGKSFILEGWIRAGDVPNLQQKLESACETVSLIAREPESGEVHPVALENKKIFAPFEFVTKLYGLPSPTGLDPTPFLAPFWFVFFGLCMTDAGYGIAIALLASFGLLKVKGDSVRKLLWVLFAGGLSTVVFGWLLGGWFGVPLFGAPLLFNPLLDPMPMLTYALILGLLQIFFGMAIQFVRLLKQGRVFDALADVGLWYVLIIGLLMYIAPGMAGVAKTMSLIGAAGLVLTQGRTQPTIIKKLFSGVLSLYNITGYLSDVLSYSRLLALGLATGVIAIAINTMAGLLKGSPIGFVLMIILLIGGHTFNLVINTLGSYIHSSRLQYIEFYNRFYEGGGRNFVPFQLKTRHLEVSPEWSKIS
jgi:V/A-type H+-transporting ATPase subunit I